MTVAKSLSALALYICLALSATPAPAADRDLDALANLRQGDMRKLAFVNPPVAAPDVAFVTETGAEITLADLRGKVILLNFWATWCAPCRHEMPALNRVQKLLGSEDFAVVTVATGRNPPPAIAAFFEEAGVDALPAWRDPKQALARAMSIFGLPMTIVLDEQGREIARLRGDAEWDSPEAIALIRAIVGAGS